MVHAIIVTPCLTDQERGLPRLGYKFLALIACPGCGIVPGRSDQSDNLSPKKRIQTKGCRAVEALADRDEENVLRLGLAVSFDPQALLSLRAAGLKRGFRDMTEDSLETRPIR